jgi:hypothetical protein
MCSEAPVTQALNPSEFTPPERRGTYPVHLDYVQLLKLEQLLHDIAKFCDTDICNKIHERVLNALMITNNREARWTQES